jgi:peptidoglycan hydrolase-like protein with peptidoglycan-binding domain
MDAHEEFIARLYPAARKISAETGMSWELMLAQAAHETGWGRKSLPGTNNAYNVKAAGGWTGETKTFKVWERNKQTGEVYWVDDAFRVYDSVEDSMRDRVKFLRENPRYAAAGLFDEGTIGVLEAEASALEKAGFASDLNYANKLVAVFRGRTMRRTIARVTGEEVSPETVSAGIRNGTLREGHHSVAVGELQSRLHRLGYDGPDGTPLTADQDFGRRTRLALEAFQREHQLEADGIAGRATLAAIERAVRTELRSIGQSDAPYLRAEEPNEALDAYQSLAPEPTLAVPVLPVISSAQAEPNTDALQAAASDRPDPSTTRTLQENLNTLGVVDMKGEALAVDGLYGPATRTAVARFQSGHDLPITGLTDETTRSTAQGQAFITELQGLAPPTVSREAPTLETVRTRGPEQSTPAGPNVSRSAAGMDSPSSGLEASDPRNPESSTHDLYNELQRCVPDASENRLLQFTAACHENMITAENLTTLHLDEERMTLDFRGSGPLATPAQVDLSVPPPKPEQAVEQIQQFDEQEVQMAQSFQAQSMQMGQQGMAR